MVATIARTLTEDDVRRRIEFLMTEARQEHPIRDRSVTFVMRTISNYCWVGRDCDSNYLKRKSPFRSREADRISRELPEADWLKKVTNEHQEPLQWIWSWMCEQKERLDTTSVIVRFKQWPVVIVTLDENVGLRSLRNKSSLEWTPADRYREARIEVLKREDDHWVPMAGPIASDLLRLGA